MKTIAGSALVLCATVCMAVSAAAQTPVGALAIDERQGGQYGWAVDYETAGSGATARAVGVRLGVLGGADVRALRGLRGGPGGGQLGDRVGGVVRLVGRGPGTGSVGVRLAGRFGVHGSGVGLQRPGGRGRAGSGPCGASPGSGGPASRRLRPWRSGRDVRAANARGNPELAGVTGCSDDGLSGRRVCGGATTGGGNADAGTAWGRCGGGYGGGFGGAAAGAGWRGARGRCGAPVERGSRDIRFLGYLERYRDSGRIVVDGRGYPWRPGSEQPLSDSTMRRRARSDLGIRDPARVLGAHNLRVVKVRVRRQGGARADIGRGTPVHVVQRHAFRDRQPDASAGGMRGDGPFAGCRSAT